MGALAESFGLRAGLKYRKPIKEALETVLRLDPAFQNGSADRALGRWYARVPGLFGGSNKLAEAHLRTSLRYDQDSTISHFFLAELLLDEGRKSEARVELQSVIDAPIKPEVGPGRRRLPGAGARDAVRPQVNRTRLRAGTLRERLQPADQIRNGRRQVSPSGVQGRISPCSPLRHPIFFSVERHAHPQTSRLRARPPAEGACRTPSSAGFEPLNRHHTTYR